MGILDASGGSYSWYDDSLLRVTDEELLAAIRIMEGVDNRTLCASDFDHHVRCQVLNADDCKALRDEDTLRARLRAFLVLNIQHARNISRLSKWRSQGILRRLRTHRQGRDLTATVMAGKIPLSRAYRAYEILRRLTMPYNQLIERQPVSSECNRS